MQTLNSRLDLNRNEVSEMYLLATIWKYSCLVKNKPSEYISVYKKEPLGLKLMGNNYTKTVKTITQRNLCSYISIETEKDKLRKSWN